MPRKAKPTSTDLDRDWKVRAEATRAKAKRLPDGAERDAMMRMARQLELACHMRDWLKSPDAPSPSA